MFDPQRLIPAWAGKTSTPMNTWRSGRAHPRVGGENAVAAMRAPNVGWLIPAWAGKTRPSRRRRRHRRAHPRVGGENITRVLHFRDSGGSSPRGRGKHFLTCAFIERIGQILETLELAVSSESYTLSAAYATDAPQDQARNTALVLPSSRGAS